MNPRPDKPRGTVTLDDYKDAYGSFIDADGYEWVRMMPREEMARREQLAKENRVRVGPDF